MLGFALIAISCFLGISPQQSVLNLSIKKTYMYQHRVQESIREDIHEALRECAWKKWLTVFSLRNLLSTLSPTQVHYQLKVASVWEIQLKMLINCFLAWEGSCSIVQLGTCPLWNLEACSGCWIWKLYSNTCPSNWWTAQFWSVQQVPWLVFVTKLV